MSKLQLVRQIWPAVYFCTTCKPKNDFHMFKWLWKNQTVIFWDTWKSYQVQISGSMTKAWLEQGHTSLFKLLPVGVLALLTVDVSSCNRDRRIHEVWNTYWPFTARVCPALLWSTEMTPWFFCSKSFSDASSPTGQTSLQSVILSKALRGSAHLCLGPCAFLPGMPRASLWKLPFSPSFGSTEAVSSRGLPRLPSRAVCPPDISGAARTLTYAVQRASSGC